MNGLLAGLGYPVIAVISVFVLSVVGFVLYGMTAKKRGGKVSLEREADRMAEMCTADELFAAAVEFMDHDKDIMLGKALMLRAAQKGSAEAQLYFGKQNQYNKNDVAVDWLKKSAAQGNEEASERLGRMYYFGENIGKPKINANPSEAVKWLTPLAENGNVEIQKLLALCYSLKLKDDEQELKWLKRAAETGDEEAAESLVLYYGAHGDEENEKLWNKMLADRNNASAQYELGISCEFAEKSDMEQAVKWYKKSADNGYSMAKIKLAGLYLIGYGVEKDVERAVKIYREESAAGDEYATYRLGLCYLEGTGMDKDEKKAVALFEKSSELPFSKYRLAVCLLDGVGTAKDEARAFRLLTEADKDIADADIKDKLSECLYYGKGTSADRDEANRLWREAEEIRKNEEYI